MKPSKHHWEDVFLTKTPDQVSWTEAYPQTSVDLIQSFHFDISTPIIDVGGGDSRLIDVLLQLGFLNLTVLDISVKALERAQARLGRLAKRVHWIESDVLSFHPEQEYGLWHDRASFHFLTQPDDIQIYKQILNHSKAQHLVIGTFSTTGPKKCSGLPINQYHCEKLKNCFAPKFIQLDCIETEHLTPFDTTQNFIFSRFNKIV